MLTLILFLLTGASPPQQVSLEERMAEASRLRSQYRDEEALEVYLEVLGSQPDHHDAVTGASYLYGRIGSEKASLQNEYYPMALELARQALRLQPDHPETHLVMAWALGGVAQTSGTRKRVRLAREVKTHVDRAIELRPEDHRAWYILASWHYKVSKAGFWERAAARILFGGLPREASIEEAISAFEKAVELKSDSIAYRFELARALANAGRKDEGSGHLEAALILEPETPYQARIQQQCRRLLKSQKSE